MTGEIFYWVFNMSAAAAVTGLLILPLRAVRALPRRTAVFLWLVPLLRMCVPVGVDSRFSLVSLISRYATRTVVVSDPSLRPELSYLNTVTAAESYFPVTYKSDALAALFRTAGVIWAAVLFAAAALLCAQYAAAMREARRARPIGDDVYVSDTVRGPAVYGIFRPRILLPADTPAGGETAGYVLMHERAHIRRADNLWRLIALIAAAVHWFNPLAWVFLRLFLSDLEQACDESVLSALGEAERKRYAMALLDSAKGGGAFASAFGGAGLRSRIENILSYRRVTVFSAVCFALLTAAVIFVLTTNAG